MRSFLVVGVLMATSALAQSLPGQQVSKLVLLADEAKAVTLPPPPPAILNIQPEDPFAPVYRRMVLMQMQLLEFQRVSIAGPLTLTLIGGTAALIGVTMLAMGSVSYGFFIVGLVALSGSSLPLLVGIPWLVGTLNTNARISREIERVKHQPPGRPDLLDGAVLGTF